ncbi:MAG: flavodoxin [Spirochaetia bacterium]|jgi:flavodoxin
MKRKLALLILTFSTILLIAHTELLAAKPKILVAYYSRTGNTREIASQIHSLIGGDMFEIQPVVPYPADYEAVKKKATEEQEAGYKPALKSKVKDFGSYDTILVGSPVWWGTLPPPVSSFLSEYDFAGKTIIPFCTHLGSGQGRTISAITALCPQSKILKGIAIRGDAVKSAKKDVSDWLRMNGLAGGER